MGLFALSGDTGFHVAPPSVVRNTADARSYWTTTHPCSGSGKLSAATVLALHCTSLAYLLYFSLIASVGPMKTLSVTYLVPAFGIVWSALFLHERLNAGTFIGLVIILASVVLVTGTRIASRGVNRLRHLL